MGYTHYWSKTRKFTQPEWTAIKKAAQAIIDETPVELCWEFDREEKPVEISVTKIRFNGLGDDGHETFYFTRSVPPEPEYRKGEGDFQFTKTARKPYDDAVVACLIAFQDIAPDAFTWSSDGWLHEHGDGLDLFNKACERDLEWSNAEVSDEDPDRDKVTNVVSLEYEKDKRA